MLYFLPLPYFLYTYAPCDPIIIRLPYCIDTSMPVSVNYSLTNAAVV